MISFKDYVAVVSITVQVANRAKRRRFEEFDGIDDPMVKPVMRAIIEMSDEMTQPEIIGE